MSESEYNWEKLWDVFEKLTLASPVEHEAIIESLCPDNQTMKKELKQLLKAHYSQSTLLDQQPYWQEDFLSNFQPPEHIQGYKIEQKLGSGGLGDVYLASKLDEGFDRKVAIKFATAGRYSSPILHSFKNELQILLSLNHPHIERLFEGGVTDEKIPYLIVEYIDGDHVDRYCDEQKLGVLKRLKLFQDVCSAVDTVHRSLIIHRDIKAANIMVDKQGSAKLLDFGVAKLTSGDASIESTNTNLSNFMMTMAYASPEQINGAQITTTSDIYSLGVLLYYLLTGKYPYEIDVNDLSSSIKIISEVKPKFASDSINTSSGINSIETNLTRILKGELDQILAKSLAKNPDRRYLSAAQFSDDIQTYLDNKPVIAKPDSLLYRMKKFVLRHKLSVVSVSLAVLSLISLSLILLIQSNQLKQSIQEIQQEQKRVLHVTGFLKDIFNVSDPLLTDKKIVNVVDLLDYSSQQLESQFNDEPSTKAALYQTLGNVYLNMSLLPQSETMLQKAGQLFEQLGDLSGIVNTDLAMSRLLQQKSLFIDADVILERVFQPELFSQLEKSLQAKAEVVLGQNKYQLGKVQEAKVLLESALLKRLDLLGEEHQLVVDIYQLLGNVHWRLGKFKKVKMYYQKSYDINLDTLGLTHHKSLKSLSSLGVLAFSQGNYKKAKETFDTVANTRLQKLGDRHILTAEAFNRLGAVYYELGDYVNAEIQLNQALIIFKNINLENSMKFAKALNNLGLVERQNRNYQKAKDTFLVVKQIEINLLGEKHSDVASMYNNLGTVSADLGQTSEAKDLFKQAHDILLENNGLDNPSIAYSMTNIGRMYLQLNEIEMAKTWIDKALKLRLKKLGENNLYYIESLSASAEVDIELGNIEVAKISLNKVIRVRKEQLPKTDWRIFEAENIYAFISFADNPLANKVFQCSLIKLREQFGDQHYRYKAAVLRQQKLKLKPNSELKISC